MTKEIRDEELRELINRTLRVWETMLGTDTEEIAFIRGWKLGFESSLKIFEELIGT